MTTFANQLHSLFQQQISKADQLHKCLVAENEALVNRDFTALQTLAANKLTLTTELEQLAQSQTQLLTSNGHESTPEGLENAIKQLPTSVRLHLSKIKTSLETTLEQGQQQNIINGSIIAANQQSAEMALAILRGNLSPNNLTYGAEGRTISEGRSNSSIKA